MSRSVWLLGTAVTIWMAFPVSAQSVSSKTFKNPPPVYRPIGSGNGGGGSNADSARKTLLENQAGALMFSPRADPKRDRPLFDNGNAAVDPGYPNTGAVIGGRPVGLQDNYPAGSSPWLMKALPGEAGTGSFGAPPSPPPPPGATGAPGAAAAPSSAPPPPRMPAARSPGFMTDEWFAQVREALTVAKSNGRFATFYDEVGFPSGSANFSIPTEYYRKVLRRDVRTLSPQQLLSLTLPTDGTIAAVVARNVRNGRQIDLLPLAAKGRIDWRSPDGDWRIETYSTIIGSGTTRGLDYVGTADYMDPAAVDWFIDATYGKLAANLRPFLGNTINMTFFDDVGIFPDEKTWNPQISARFEKLTGRPAAAYYPALWDDIGADTAAARVGFFRARAELLGEGLPKRITDWGARYGVKSSGHAPGQYDIQPVDMSGDPFKFYAYTSIPMADVIFGHGLGREGFKLISSVSAARDLPITAAETFSSGATNMGYRRMIELYNRGINRFVAGGIGRGGGLRGTAAEFNLWAGRTSLMLQGGRHVADIAVVYPIESLQAFYAFDATDNKWPLPWGSYAYQDADYQAVGAMLTDDLHRDFTFVHPDALGTAKFTVAGNNLVMENRVNRERYRVVLMPGGAVLSTAALAKVKAFYDAGGTVIATSLLPSKSAEFGQDAQVQAMVTEMFGINPAQAMPDGVSTPRTNARGGKAVFVRKPDQITLQRTLDSLGQVADVSFVGNPAPRSGNGVFGYIHRVKDGRDIYYFGNSSDTPVVTKATMRGRLTQAEFWDPLTGNTTPAAGLTYGKAGNETTTSVDIDVGALTGMFLVGRMGK